MGDKGGGEYLGLEFGDGSMFVAVSDMDEDSISM